MAADWNYSEQIITLIKSVCYHHQNVKFYLLNKEYPIEWFHCLNEKLNQINCEIIDVKVITDIFNGIKIFNRVTSPTLYRYFTPELPEDRILYLDCDVIVDSNLDEFFLTPFQEMMVVASKDIYLTEVEFHYHRFPNLKLFNAGVLLINNKLWKEQNIQQILCDFTLQNKDLLFLDQDVLNIILDNKWLEVDKIYNYQIGARTEFVRLNMLAQIEEFDKLDKNPAIIHYAGDFKPWQNNTEFLKLRDKYWFYYSLDWSEIITKN